MNERNSNVSKFRKSQLIQNSKFKIQNFGEGFTLIELLVSLAVLSLMAAVVFVGYRGMSARFELKTQSSKVLDVFNLAHARTVSSLDASQYGVHVEQTQYVLFKGATYSAGDPDNVVYALSSSVEISDITLLGGGVDVLFDRLTGKTSQAGTFRVRLVSDNSRYKIVEVLASGRSDIPEGTLAPAGTRVSDTRHVHFNYAQNVQDAGTLTLTFPDGGPLVQNITFKDYISGGVFDWSGTVTVNGSDQILRIHTHTMGASDADFSVTRDLRYNNEALEISLDTQNLVSYAADGTVTAGPFWISGLQAQ